MMNLTVEMAATAAGYMLALFAGWIAGRLAAKSARVRTARACRRVGRAALRMAQDVFQGAVEVYAASARIMTGEGDAILTLNPPVRRVKRLKSGVYMIVAEGRRDVRWLDGGRAADLRANGVLVLRQARGGAWETVSRPARRTFDFVLPVDRFIAQAEPVSLGAWA